MSMSCWSLLRSRLTICLHIHEPTELALMTKSRKSSIVEDRCINGTKRNSVAIFAPCLASSNRC